MSVYESAFNKVITKLTVYKVSATEVDSDIRCVAVNDKGQSSTTFSIECEYHNFIRCFSLSKSKYFNGIVPSILSTRIINITAQWPFNTCDYKLIDLNLNIFHLYKYDYCSKRTPSGI